MWRSHSLQHAQPGHYSRPSPAPLAQELLQGLARMGYSSVHVTMLAQESGQETAEEQHRLAARLLVRGGEAAWVGECDGGDRQGEGGEGGGGGQDSLILMCLKLQCASGPSTVAKSGANQTS